MVTTLDRGNALEREPDRLAGVPDWFNASRQAGWMRFQELPMPSRKDEEWRGGHIPKARHAFLGTLEGDLDALHRDTEYAAYCQSGFRASIAASLMHRAGFSQVANVPGSFGAWQAQGYPVET